MNRNNSRRSLREVLTGWLRALLRPGPARTPGTTWQGEDQIEPAQSDVDLPGDVQPESGQTFHAETRAGGERGGPPEHWQALARSKGPPQHWLDMIRARLGDDLSRVPWIRARALPPQARLRVETRTSQPPQAKETRSAQLAAEPSEVFPAGEESGAPFSQENEAALAPSAQPLPAAERSQPTAMRIYPAPDAAQKKPADQPPPAPPAERESTVENTRRAEDAPQTARPAQPRPVPLADARVGTQVYSFKPPPAGRPVSAQRPAPPEPAKAPAARPQQTAPEPPLALSQAVHWPVWQEPSLAGPMPRPEQPAEAPGEPINQHLPGLSRSDWSHPLPPQQPQPPPGEPEGAPNIWPALFETAPAEERSDRDLSASLAPTDRWPALGRLEDDELAGDEWESYQRNWQRLERLRREQQGQLWSEWPF